MSVEAVVVTIGLPVGFAIVGWLVNDKAVAINRKLEIHGESLENIDKRLSKQEFILTGVDEINGVRGDVKELAEEQKRQSRTVGEILSHLHYEATKKQNDVIIPRPRKKQGGRRKADKI